MNINYSDDVATALPWLEQFFSLNDLSVVSESGFFQASCGQIASSLAQIASHEKLLAYSKAQVASLLKSA